jgi:hypothetical protein
VSGAKTDEFDGGSMAGEKTVNREQVSPLDRCLATAEQLLEILRAETLALKGFEKERILELVANKEALVSELVRGMRLVKSSQASFARTAQESSRQSGPAGASQDANGEDLGKRVLLRGLLDQIMKSNNRNHVFVQGFLGYWQDLLTLCLPGTYALSHLGQAAKQPLAAKGLALNREI